MLVSYYNVLRVKALDYEFAREVKMTFRTCASNTLTLGSNCQLEPAVPDQQIPLRVPNQLRKRPCLSCAVMHLSREPKTWKLRLRTKIF